MLEGALPLKRDYAIHSNGVVLPSHILLLVAALAAAVVAQGGYYLPGRIVAAALVGLALILALRVRHMSWTNEGPVLAAGAGLAGWAVIRAALAGEVVAAIPTVVSVVCLVGALLVAARTDPNQRALCASVAVGIGVLVAVSGWIAVVWRIPSWSTVSDGLSRAASTLTYPNAAAALLASLAVLAICRQLAQPRSPTRAAATYLLLVGLGATLSRAGLLALLVGLVVVSLLAGVRSTVRQTAPPALGAAVAVGALAPSFPIAEPARPALALAGLTAGLAITVGLNLLRAKVQTIAQLAGLALTVAGLVTVLGSGQLTDRFLEGRVALGSPDRAGATGAALDIVAVRPVTGVGPGQGWFTWTAADGTSRVIRYVHNEYLQVLVELGAIGLALVLCLLVAFVVVIRRGRPPAGPRPLWAGAVAALAVLLVHSGLDFLWHIPAALLVAGFLAGLAAPAATMQAKENP